MQAARARTSSWRSTRGSTPAAGWRSRGTLQQGRGLQWLDADAGSLEARAGRRRRRPTRNADPRAGRRRRPKSSSARRPRTKPTSRRATTVRIQFSRDIDPATLKGRIRVRYLEAQTRRARRAGDAGRRLHARSTARRNRVLELQVREAARAVPDGEGRALGGILGTDKQPLKPWTLTFQTGVAVKRSSYRDSARQSALDRPSASSSARSLRARARSARRARRASMPAVSIGCPTRMLDRDRAG